MNIGQIPSISSNVSNCRNARIVNRPPLSNRPTLSIRASTSPIQSNTGDLGKIALCALCALALIGVLFAAYTYCKNAFFSASKFSYKKGEYPEEGKQALAYADTYLRDNSTTSLLDLDENNQSLELQPNEKIKSLESHIKEAKKTLIQALKPNGTWNEEAIAAADHYMKLSYASSCLMLENAGVGQPGELAETIPVGAALTHQFRQNTTPLSDCSVVYSQLRENRIAYRVQPKNNPLNEIPTLESHSAPFYQKGTTQNRWRELYNDYCERVRLYVKIPDSIHKRDDRPKMIGKDTGPKLLPENYEKKFGFVNPIGY